MKWTVVQTYKNLLVKVWTDNNENIIEREHNNMKVYVYQETDMFGTTQYKIIESETGKVISVENRFPRWFMK